MPVSEPYTLYNLRADIRAAELAVANINPNSNANQVLDLFSLLDRIAPAYKSMSQSRIDLRSEITRIETIYGILNDKSRVIARALSDCGGLTSFRAEHTPPSSHWWWYLDWYIDKQNQRAKEKRLRGLGIAILILASTVTLYVAFLRPDVTIRKKVALILAAQADLQSEDYTSALANYQKARALATDDAEINLMIGIMYQALNRSADADEQYAKTIKLYETRAAFTSAKSQKYSTLGWYDQALSDASRAIELDQQFAPGHCALATAYEGQGQYASAIAALQVCADLAFEQEQHELYLVAKTRLGNLLQTQR